MIKRIKWRLKRLNGSEKRGNVIAPNTIVFQNYEGEVEFMRKKL